MLQTSRLLWRPARSGFLDFKNKLACGMRFDKSRNILRKRKNKKKEKIGTAFAERI